MKTIINFYKTLLVGILLIPILSTAQKISGGYSQSFAICSDSVLRAWGDNSAGQLGDGTYIHKYTPTSVNGLTKDINAIEAGGAHTLALKNDGTVWSWGVNNSGELGDGTTVNRNIPGQVIGLTEITAISAGNGYSLALKKDSTVWMWGYCYATGTVTVNTTPAKIDELNEVIAIYAGPFHALALKSDGTVWAWGNNNMFQLGDGTYNPSKTPVKSNISGVKAIAAGSEFSLALKEDGTVWGWGHNLKGELGNGALGPVLIPTQATLLTGIIAIAAGSNHTLALKGDGTVWASGENYCGQLGNGSNQSSKTHMQVTGLTDIEEISAGSWHSLALKKDGTLYTWGYNHFGQIGDGTTESKYVPFYLSSLCMTASNEELTVLQENTITIFPNPASDRININSSLANYNLKLFNVKGELILCKQDLNFNEVIDISSYLKGIYLLQFQSDTDVINKKVIIN